MAREALTQAVRKILTDAPMGLKELAEQSGLSYDVLRSWRTGRRSPNASSARRLLSGLEQKAGRLSELTDELRRAVEAAEAPRPAATARKDVATP